MKRKEYFRTPSAAMILGMEPSVEVRLRIVNSILEADPESAIIIKKSLIPKAFRTSRKFMKHGDVIRVKKQKSLASLLEEPKTPADSLVEAISGIRSRAYSGYIIRPFIGQDRRARRFSLVECLEGAKIYSYCHSEIPFRPHIKIRPYDDAKRVRIEGTEIYGMVPSRSRGMGNYEIKLSSVPVIESDERWGISYNISSSHNCKSKLFSIRYNYENGKESSRELKFCSHEFAMYMEIIDHYLKQGNTVPLEQCQFALPTRLTAEFYKRLENSVVIQEKRSAKPRKLNQAEKEILLWGLVYTQVRDNGLQRGAANVFYANEKPDPGWF